MSSVENFKSKREEIKEALKSSIIQKKKNRLKKHHATIAIVAIVLFTPFLATNIYFLFTVSKHFAEHLETHENQALPDFCEFSPSEDSVCLTCHQVAS